MRVLHIVSEGKMGGLQSHVLCINACLRSAGIDSRVCIIGQADFLGKKLGESQIPFVALNGSSGHDCCAFIRYVQLVRRFQPHIVHFHDAPLLPMMYYKVINQRQKVVASLHTSWRPRYNLRMRFQRWLRSRVELFLPVSQATWCRYLKDSPWASGVVFYNPIKIDALPDKDCNYIRNELKVQKDVKIIGTIGRMTLLKDIPSFLRACRILMDERDSVHAVVVGDGELLQSHISLWNSLSGGDVNVRNRLHWLGKRNDATKLIGGMDVLLMTSYSEEMPTMMLEAFGMHTPVAGFIPMGGTAEVLELPEAKKIALLNKCRDIGSLVDDIKQLLDDPEKAKAISDNAHKCLCQHFDAMRLCRDQLIPIYEKVLNHG